MELLVKAGKNVDKANVTQYVEEAVLPELPAWYFGAGTGPECLALAGPNNFYPIQDDPFNWKPGTKLSPHHYDPKQDK
jgi:hypothetical protein